MRVILLVLSVILFSCNPTIYIVRHGEKASPVAGGSTDVPLNAAGEERALALKDALKNKHIAEVFSTNTIRTRSTVKPTADLFGLTIETYKPQPDSAFITLLKSKRKNVLVVGHSNTIDDIANMLCGLKVVPGDLQDNEYDNLYLIKKKGNHYLFSNKKYGIPNK